MIQSMEILQLPLMALEERIEQEIQNNPVLEFREPENEPGTPENPENGEAREQYFENEEFNTNGSSYRQNTSYDGERDKKLDAMNNTAARGITLAEHLLNQWAFVECPKEIRQAGAAIINYIDP